MKVLISGAGGFAGRTFLSRLYGTDAWDEQARTWRVVGQVRSRVPYIEGVGLAALSGRLTFDTRPPSPANRVCDGCDLVINFAARTFRDYLDRDPAPFFRDNVAHVADLLADARACGVRRLIHTLNLAENFVYEWLPEDSNGNASQEDPVPVVVFPAFDFSGLWPGA